MGREVYPASSRTRTIQNASCVQATRLGNKTIVAGKKEEKNASPLSVQTPPRLRRYTIPTPTHHPFLAPFYTPQWLLPPLARASALGPQFASHRDDQPYQPQESRNDPVPDFPLGRVVAELETQAAVDDAQRDEHTTPPDMGGAPERAAVGALEDAVVGDAEERLEDEKGDDHQADDGVSVVNLLGGVSY